jgi:hypothetical protein
MSLHLSIHTRTNLAIREFFRIEEKSPRRDINRVANSKQGSDDRRASLQCMGSPIVLVTPWLHPEMQELGQR